MDSKKRAPPNTSCKRHETLGTLSQPNICVVIPTYNERENIERLLMGLDSAFRSLNAGGSIIIVDDNSADGTAVLAAKFRASCADIKVVVRPDKLGVGSAILQGLERGFESKPKARFFFQMDADLSHPPELLGNLVGALLQGHDVVVGSRYCLGGRIVGWPVLRRVVSRAANSYARVMLGLPVRDVTSGFKGYTRDVVSHLLRGGVVSEGYSFQVEMLFKLRRAGFGIVEHPITFVERRSGRSKLGLREVVTFLYAVPAFRLLRRQR